jgi:predicted nucleic acid-binding protein
LSFLLDTNVAIHLADGDSRIMAKVKALTEAAMLSIVTRVELEGGVYREPAHAAVRRARLDTLLPSFLVLPFDEAAADAYRDIVAAVGFSRRKVIDRMIAAQALAHRATLATMNPADVTDVPGLQIEAW